MTFLCYCSACSFTTSHRAPKLLAASIVRFGLELPLPSQNCTAPYKDVIMRGFNTAFKKALFFAGSCEDSFLRDASFSFDIGCYTRAKELKMVRNGDASNVIGDHCSAVTKERIPAERVSVIVKVNLV